MQSKADYYVNEITDDVKRNEPEIVTPNKLIQCSNVNNIEDSVLNRYITVSQNVYSPTPTVVSGTISQDTAWTIDNSPYVLQGSVTIATGATLAVQPGVVVKATSSSSCIYVNGKLNAVGTAEAPVIFTAEKDSVEQHFNIVLNSKLKYQQNE
jgi:hypothetical protein